MGRSQLHIACSECRMASSVVKGGAGSVTVSVPVKDGAQRTVCHALVECHCSGTGHTLELVGTVDGDGGASPLPVDELQMLGRKLDVLEKRAICGTPGICPQAMVEFVHHG